MPFFCRTTATLSGFLVCASPPTAATPSLSPVAGTGLWRYISSVSQTTLIVFNRLPNDLKKMACITWHFSDAFFADEGTCHQAQHYNNLGLNYTEVWLSSVGVEPGQLQAEDQPHWSRWLPEHSDCLSWWLPVCIRWKGMKSTVVNDSRTVFGLAGFISDESEASVSDWWKLRGCFWEMPAFF